MTFQIVDSVIALFRVDFTGRGELADRQVSSTIIRLHNPAFVKLFAVFKLWFTEQINSELQQKLAQMLSRLTKMAEEFNVAVYMTNQGTISCFTYSFMWLHAIAKSCSHRGSNINLIFSTTN